MIITVTLNPAIDKTAEIAKLMPGGLNRLENILPDAGGKGINVSKMIAALGGRSVATGFLGGSAGREIEIILNASGIETDFIPIAHATRTNLKVLSPEYGVTEFNEPGAAVTAAEMLALRDKLMQYAKPGVTFVFSGNLPRNVASDTYQELTDVVKEKGAAVFLDADGEAFGQALSARPDFIKPNKFELMQYFGIADELSLAECAALCRRLIDKGIRLVALSMGADGALFVSAGETLYAPGLSVPVRSTVGAGDSMVGALVYAFERGLSLEEAATYAMAASAGAVTTEGTKPPTRETVEALMGQVKFQGME